MNLPLLAYVSPPFADENVAYVWNTPNDAATAIRHMMLSPNFVKKPFLSDQTTEMLYEKNSDSLFVRNTNNEKYEDGALIHPPFNILWECTTKISAVFAHIVIINGCSPLERVFCL